MKKYPIYGISLKWLTKGIGKDSEYFKFMTKRKLSSKELTKKLEKAKNNSLLKVGRNKFKKWVSTEIKYIESEEWICGWFDHRTFNSFKSKSEAFINFSKYVSRKKNDPQYCLMGAEDEWRWSICNCKECQKSRMTIINH
jgi:hypothetical protein